VTALIAALSLSGLPCHSFIFEGFLPVKSAGRRKKLEEFKGLKKTVIFYESPHRLLKVLQDMEGVLPEARIVCAREITKKFEEVKEGAAKELLVHFSVKKPKGEFVLLIHPKGV
jgi:16S rRNA (cytidine1402-2'-O)-methyltransferase